MRLYLRAIGLVLDVFRPDIPPLGKLHVLRDINHNGAGPPVGRHIKGLMQNARQVIDVLHQPVVLGAGTGDANCVAFLERVIANQMGWHLPRQADHRDRIKQSVGEAGDRVGGAGAGGHQHNAAFAGGARITFGRMGGPLLMAHQYVLYLVLLENLVVNGKYRTPGIAKYMFHPVIGQSLQHDLGTRH